ncbi:MAG: ECF-type sigma factor [Rudaea sp.]|uniref:ECF-type sigma factor n=1 Tax=Rudaea sp. TaxID=2136325 RepID=UPI0039E2BC3A
MSTDSVASLLAAWRSGDQRAPHALAELVYADLRSMASRMLRDNRGAGALQTTELAHEAYLRLLQHPLDFVDRTHFFRTLALAVRQVLIDAARREHAGKRGGDALTVGISAAADLPTCGPDTWLGIETALVELESLDARKSRVVEMVFLLGLSQEETAQMLGVSLPTVERDLRFARAWLRARIES